MNSTNYSEELRADLIDALDSPPRPEQLAQLKSRVMAYDPALWDHFLWMQKQKVHPGGIFVHLEHMHNQGPDEAAVTRFIERKQGMHEAGTELDQLVWSWFRRYIFAPASIMIVLLGALHLGHISSVEVNGRQELESFLGWDADLFSDDQAIPELTHWLYQDLDRSH